MVSVYKSTIVISLLILGTFLILLSTYNFAYRIPSLDFEINKKETDRYTVTFAMLSFQMGQISDIVAHENMIMLKELKPNSSMIGKINGDLQQIRIGELIDLHKYVRGDIPNNEFLNSLKNLNNDELEKMKVNMVPEEQYFNKVSIEISNLKSKKDKVQFWSVIIQILGLFFINLASILEIKLLK